MHYDLRVTKRRIGKLDSVEFGIAAKALGVWTSILVLAVANGALREAILIPRLGKAAGLVLSGLLLSGLILVVAYLSLPWLSARGLHELLAVGLGWLFLTLAFEFSFDLLRGKPLGEILEAYTFKDGNIWPVVLLAIALAPWVAAKLRSWV